MKQSLNEIGTFSDFLFKFAENWMPKTTNEGEGTDMTLDSTSSTPLPTSVVPGRNRVPWFNSPCGKRLRLSSDGHDLVSAVYPKKKCLMCDIKTTRKCGKCGVHLCRFPFGRNRTSCWHNNHSRQSVTKTPR